MPGRFFWLRAAVAFFFLVVPVSLSSSRLPFSVFCALTSGSGAPSKGSPHRMFASRSLIFCAYSVDNS